MVAADLTRANERVATVERRNVSSPHQFLDIAICHLTPQELLRAEIESVRSGSGQAERVKSLESQISELEAEASRLLKALDQLKEAKAESERALQRKVDEAAREASTQVGTKL